MIWWMALALASPLSDRFTAHHDALLDDPATYRAAVHAQASAFPEGPVFPYVLAVHGYMSVAMAEPAQTKAALARMETLLAPAIVAVEARLGGPLLSLDDVGNQATWAGQLQLALACYHRLGGKRWLAERRHLDAQFAKALTDRQGKPLDSLPGLIWPFDTIPVLLALRLADVTAGTEQYTAHIRRHLTWLTTHGLTAQGVPFSRAAPETFAMVETSRGCDLSWRLPLLAQLEPVLARELYDAYVAQHWDSAMGFGGFREWPHGVERSADADSGPIVGGLGVSASGLGIGAATAAADDTRRDTLSREAEEALRMMPMFRAVSRGEDLPYDPRFLTGMAMGDAVMFASAAWTNWSVALGSGDVGPPAP